MRWKPLVDCYRRHEAPGGILAVENARGLQSQTQPDETDSRPGRYLRHPYPAAERYIPSIVYIPLWLLILLSFLSHSFFLFSFDEIQRSGNATCIIKCGEKNMTGSRNNFVYPCNGSRSWWKFRLFEILFTGRIFVDRWFSRGLWFRDVEKWETRAVSMDSLAPGSQDLGIMKIVGDLTDGGLKLKFLYKRDRDWNLKLRWAIKTRPIYKSHSSYPTRVE